MNLDDIIKDFKKQKPRFDPLQQYEVIKRFVEEKEQLSLEDLNKLEVATIFDNAWCRKYENKNCEGCPIYEFEEKWGCIDTFPHGYESRYITPHAGHHHPFYKKIDHVWYCITALKEHDEEVSRQDLLNAVDEVINYLREVIKEQT